MPPGIHGHGYWLDENSTGHHFDTRLSKALIKFFTGHSVLDAGCGRANYVMAMHKAGIDCHGCDGNPFMYNSLCSTIDLSRRFVLPRIYDWVMSLEVGEHIPKEFEGTFLSNLDRHNRRGVVLSWATPGQGGRGHVNEQTNEYIKGVMFDRGYFSCGDWEVALRQEARLPWFKNTIMVFKRMRPQ